MIEVEMRDDAGVVTSRLRIEGSDFTAGRSPECAVLIDDPFVDGEHFTATRLEDGSGLSILDAGSKNGTRVAGRPTTGTPTPVPWGTPVLVGRTTLHFRDPDAPVAEAQELPANDGRLFDYTRIPGWTTAAVAVAMLSLWTGSAMYDPVGWAEGLGLAIGMFALIMLWTGLWAGLSRLFAGRARFRTHLGFGAACALIMVPISIPLGWVAFAMDHPIADFAINWLLLGFGLWAIALFGHLDIASRKPMRFKAVLACVLSAALLGMGWGFTQMEGTPVDQVQRSLLVLAPIPDGLTRTSSLDDFLSAIGDLPEEHDRDVEQADDE